MAYSAGHNDPCADGGLSMRIGRIHHFATPCRVDHSMYLLRLDGQLSEPLSGKLPLP